LIEILPGANTERLLFHLEVLGTATLTDKGEGFYCYLFYDRIERLAGERRLLKRILLGDVLAHETNRSSHVGLEFSFPYRNHVGTVEWERAAASFSGRNVL